MVVVGSIAGTRVRLDFCGASILLSSSGSEEAERGIGALREPRVAVASIDPSNKGIGR